MPGKRRLHDPATLAALEQLHDQPLNFDLAEQATFGPETGWTVDDYCQPLPGESPGPPEPGGTWERARELMLDYEFADPRQVRAVYAPNSELEGRDMLLEVRFWRVIRLRFGVRVGSLVDWTRSEDGRQARIWGWSYRTLQDHLEMGQMDYQVWKWTDSGDVEFRIHVVSRPASIPNPVIRLGFRLFSRREQIRFARRACERMACLLGEGHPPSALDERAVRA